MVDLYREVSRLEMIVDVPVGLESFSLVERTKDLVRNFFTRFSDNIKHREAVFLHSELALFAMRYKSQMDKILVCRDKDLADYIVPVPKAMVKTYDETLRILMGILEDVAFHELEDDMDHLVTKLDSDFDYTFVNFGKEDFEKCRSRIGALYAKTGLTHGLASKAFTDRAAITTVYNNLRTLTATEYEKVITLSKKTIDFENHHRKTIDSNHNLANLNPQIMNLAYRLTIYSTVMDHIQMMEHAFTRTLDVFRRA